MNLSETPNNSFHSFDDLQIYTNENGVRFFALQGHPIKEVTTLPFDVNVKPSTKQAFLDALDKADISEGWSHMLFDMLKKELIPVEDKCHHI